MKCECVHDQIDEYSSAALTPAEMLDIQSHLDNCVSCRKMVQQHNYFCSAMAAVEVKSVNPSTAARFIRIARLEAEQKVVRKAKLNSFYKGAAAAAFIAITAFGLNNRFQQDTGRVEPGHQLIAQTDTVKEVQVIIYVPKSMENAKIALELPEALIVDGHSGVRTLAWHTDLGQGANQLTLPLRLVPGSNANVIHSIIANIEHNNEVKTFELIVDLTDQDVSGSSVRSSFKPSFTPA